MEGDFAEVSGDIGSSDPCARLEKIKSLISQAKLQASERKDIISRTEWILSSVEEIKWYLTLGVSTEAADEHRISRAGILSKIFPKKLKELEDVVDIWSLKNGGVFQFDGVNISEIVKDKNDTYNQLAGAASSVRTDPMELEFGCVDVLHQIHVPQRARSRLIPASSAPPLLPSPPSAPLEDSDSDNSIKSDSYSVPSASGSEFHPSDESSPSSSD